METTPQRAFGTLLRHHRVERGWSQEKLAEQARLSPRGISDLERGVRQAPYRDTVERLADALELGLDERAAFAAAARRRHAAHTSDANAPLNSDLSLPFVPAPTPPLLGREQAIADVRRLLLRDTVRLLTLIGPPGIGKTRLSQQVAASLRADFTDGVGYIPLAAVRDPALVLSTIAHALHLRTVGDQSPLETLSQALGAKALLLVLDNFEQLLNAAAQLADLLKRCPGLKVLVTSRARLHLTCEHVYTVPPLALPHPAPPPRPSVAELSQYAAVALFIQRAQAVQSDFVAEETPEQLAAIVAICRRLEGIPLAIELAAARARFFTPQELLVQLERGLGVLTDGARDLPERQQTMARAIAWSVDLLEEEAARRFFLRLAVFLGGWSLEAAVVCADGPASASQIGAWLEALVDASLVVQYTAHDTGTRRYRLLEPIREYGLEQLAARGELEAVLPRHAAYFVALAEAVEPALDGLEQVVWLARLETDHDNLRAALRWAEERGAIALALRLAGTLARFWEMRGHIHEGRAWLERLLAQDAGQCSPAVRAKALQGAGRLAVTQCDYRRARALAQEGLRLHRRQGNRAGEAMCLNTLGIVMENQGTFGRSTVIFEETLAIQRALGNRQRIAADTMNLGCVLDHQGKYRRARPLYEEALALFRIGGVRRDLAVALGHMAPCVMALGEYACAHEMLRESLPILRDLGDTPRVPEVLAGLGMIAWQQGDIADAEAYCVESLALARRTGGTYAMAQALQGLGVLALARGDTAQAREYLEGILALFPGKELPKYRALALVTLGDVARAEGDHVQAYARYRESLACAKKIGNDLGVAQALEGFAHLALSEGEAAWAARLLGAAAALREAAGTPLTPQERQAVEATTTRARAEFGDAAFAAEWAAGGDMSPEQALAERESVLGLPSSLESSTLTSRDNARLRVSS